MTRFRAALNLFLGLMLFVQGMTVAMAGVMPAPVSAAQESAGVMPCHSDSADEGAQAPDRHGCCHDQCACKDLCAAASAVIAAPSMLMDSLVPAATLTVHASQGRALSRAHPRFRPPILDLA
jgi:hypothetical protein